MSHSRRTAAVAAIAALLLPASAAALPSNLTHRYQHDYHAVAAKLGERAPGRNIVRWGLPTGKHASVARVQASLSVLDRMLNPPTPVRQPAPTPKPIVASPAPQSSPQYSTPASVPTAAPPASGLAACIIQRETGGNSAASGAASGGQYQGIAAWNAQAWAIDGGTRYAPTPDGANVAEQRQVLNNALAAGHSDQWTPYDGC